MQKVALVIGKFDLLHPEHLHMIKVALERVGLNGIVAVLFGGAGQLPSLGLACTYEQRLEVLQNSLTPEEFSQICPFGVRDFGSDAEWRDCVLAKMSEIIAAEGWEASEAEVIIVVARKDASSSYVDIFPEYTVEEIPVRRTDIHASDNRYAWLKGTLGNRDDSQVLPAARIMYEQLAKSWPEYQRLQEDLNCSEEWLAGKPRLARRELIVVAHTDATVLVCEHRTAPYRNQLSLPSFPCTSHDIRNLFRNGVLSPANPWQILKELGRIRTVSKSAYGPREACIEIWNFSSTAELEEALEVLRQRIISDQFPVPCELLSMSVQDVWARRFDFIEDHPFIIEAQLASVGNDHSH